MATTMNHYTPPVAFHPGETLAEKLEEMGMSIKEFAIRVTKPEKTIIAIIRGDSSITSDMAVSFESVTQIPAHFWMNKQRERLIYSSRKEREIDSRISRMDQTISYKRYDKKRLAFSM